MSRISISRAGLPMPKLQVEFTLPDGSRVRVGMFWDEWQLVAECDGTGNYKIDDGEVAIRRRLREERTRQNGLESLGHMVNRWQWQDWRDGRIEGIVRGAMRIRERSGFAPRRAG